MKMRYASGWLGLACLVSACGGGGGEGTGGGGSGGPSGLELVVNDETIESGGVAAELEDVPLFNVVWDPSMAGIGVANNAGMVTLDYRLTASTADALDQFRFSVDGDDDQFFADIETFPGGSAIVDFRCTPTEPGDYELTITAGMVGRSGNHVSKVRCHGITDYAMIHGKLFDTLDGHDSIRVFSGATYQHSSHTLTEFQLPSTIQTSVGAPDGTLAADGKTFVYTDPGALIANDPTKYYVYLVDIETGEVTPVLTADEVAEYVNTFYGVGRALISADANLVAMMSPSAIIIKDLQAGSIEEVPLGVPTMTQDQPALTAGIFAFSSDGSKLFYGEENMTTFFAFEDLYVYDRASATSELIGAPSEQAFSAVNRFATNDAMDLFVLGAANQGSYDLRWYDKTAGVLSPLFEGALEHLATLHGTLGSIAIPDAPSISPDGKYAAVCINSWSGTDYWGGNKGAYVQDIETGQLYSVGVLPDGTHLSGDGWSLDSINVASDGAYAVFSMLWSAGIGGGLANEIGQNVIFVPRRMWVEVN